MTASTLCIFCTLFSISLSQVWFPKNELGFVYKNRNPSARVKIDVFLDLICPDSKRAYSVLRTVADMYDPSALKLKVHMFPLPYHINAFNAAKGTLAINQLTGGNRTFDWVDSVFDNMASFTNGHTFKMTAEQVLNDFGYLAETLGVKRETFSQLMTGNTQLELDARLAFKYGCTRGIHSTPMVLINDVMVHEQNPQRLTVKQWKGIIDRLL